MKIEDKLLTVNPWSRPGIKRKSTTKIAVHYTGNPGSTAIGNRNYFEGLKDQIPDPTGKWWINPDGTYRTFNGSRIGIRSVSSNYIVGLVGEVICCVPDEEIAWCTNQANDYSISIETCHPLADGIFTDKTYISLVELCAKLLVKYHLTVNDLIRHYDVTGKQCPLCWSPTKYQSDKIATAKWVTFKRDVSACMNGETPTRNNTVDVVSIINNGNSKLPYKVKINSSDGSLNVRKNAGVNNPIAMTLKNGGVFTIVAECKVGSATWGMLKSGVGWINVGSHYVNKI